LPNRVFAIFQENFNGSFDNPASWTIDNSSPGMNFSSTSLVLTANSTTKFPYIRSASQIIDSNDDTVEYKFRYPDPGLGFGNGIAITDINPPVNTVMLYPSSFAQYSMFYSWQGGGSPYFHIVTFLCPDSNPLCPAGSPTIIYQSALPDTTDHTIKIVRTGSFYTLYLDGNSIFTSAPTSRVATNVWIGHPETTFTSGSWANLEIDYIKSSVNFHPFLHRL
jgi:hypothetical protein